MAGFRGSPIPENGVSGMSEDVMRITSARDATDLRLEWGLGFRV